SRRRHGRCGPRRAPGVPRRARPPPEEHDVRKTDHQLERANRLGFHRGSPILKALDTVRLVEPLSRVVDPFMKCVRCTGPPGCLSGAVATMKPRRSLPSLWRFYRTPAVRALERSVRRARLVASRTSAA